ncbi:hypothetical protein K7432_017301 [Basidiobolus ranarum]|uniref:Uncharacterized protein n=1 Tax=Basidiobolus ranarum TaxID=34480 RepID=A0ABR2WDJ9_9FUNG
MIILREATKSGATTPLPEVEQDLPLTLSTWIGDDEGKRFLEMDDSHGFDEVSKLKELYEFSASEHHLVKSIPISNSFGNTNLSWTEGWKITDNEQERASLMRANISNLIERHSIDDRLTVGLPYNTGTGICFGFRNSKLGMMTWRASNHGDVLIQYSYEEGSHIARSLSVGKVNQDGGSKVLDGLRAVNHLPAHIIEEQLNRSEKDECGNDRARDAIYHEEPPSGKLGSIDETINTDEKYLPITTVLLTLRQCGANSCE